MKVRHFLVLFGVLALLAALQLPLAGVAMAQTSGPLETSAELDVNSAPSDVPSSQLSGRWIDANLSTATVTAMEGDTPVYSALSTIGTPNHPTPVGDFTILRRVYSETMDSSTIGIPPDAPGGYYLTDVLYTQYFTEGGAALHYNYWSPDSAFGSQAGSHGCLGLRLDDARFFWDFATVGTPVIVHY